MLLFFVALTTCTLLQLYVIFGLANAFRIPVLQLSFGAGPTVFWSNRVRLGLFPVSGFVSFVDAADASADSPCTVFENAPLHQRLLLSLVGPLSVFVLSWLCLSEQAVTEFTELPQQLFTGAVSPFSEAQRLLSGAEQFLKDSPALLVFGVVAAKHSALNLLPLPGLNGGTFFGLLARASGLHRFWPAAATGSLLFVLPVLFALWAIALAMYLWRAFG